MLVLIVLPDLVPSIKDSEMEEIEDANTYNWCSFICNFRLGFFLDLSKRSPPAGSQLAAFYI